MHTLLKRLVPLLLIPALVWGDFGVQNSDFGFKSTITNPQSEISFTSEAVVEPVTNFIFTPFKRAKAFVFESARAFWSYGDIDIPTEGPQILLTAALGTVLALTLALTGYTRASLGVAVAILSLLIIDHFSGTYSSDMATPDGLVVRSTKMDIPGDRYAMLQDVRIDSMGRPGDYPSGSYTGPDDKRKPLAFRSRAGKKPKKVSGDRLYSGDIWREERYANQLAPWLTKGLTASEIRRTAHALVVMTAVHFAVRDTLFPPADAQKIVYYQDFDIDALAARLVDNKERYNQLRDSENRPLAPDQNEELLFEHLIPADHVQLMLRDDWPVSAIIAYFRRDRPLFYQALIQGLTFRLPIADYFLRLGLFDQDKTARDRSRFSAEKWTDAQRVAQRLQKEAGLSEKDAWRQYLNPEIAAEEWLEAALADAPGVQKVLFKDQTVEWTAHYLMTSSFDALLHDAHEHRREPENLYPHLFAYRRRNGMRIEKSHRSVPASSIPRDWPVPGFDPAQGTLMDYYRGIWGKALQHPRVEEGDQNIAQVDVISPHQAMLDLSRQLQTAYARSPQEAREVAESALRPPHGEILLQKTIRPMEDNGGIAEDQTSLRELVWTILLEHSFGGADKIITRDKKSLPNHFVEVQALGHIVVTGQFATTRCLIRAEDFGGFGDPSGKFRLELLNGVPIRIWLENASASYDYLMIRDGDTGQITGWYYKHVEGGKKLQGRHLVMEADTDGNGELSAGGERPTLIPDHTYQTVARLGPAHRYERVAVELEGNVPRQYVSLQSPVGDRLALVVDTEANSRPVRSFPRKLAIEEIDALQPRHHVENLLVTGPGLTLGGETWFPISEDNKDHRIDITKIAKSVDGRTLVLEARDQATDRTFPPRPLHRIFTVPPNAAADSFQKAGLLHVYDVFCAPARLTDKKGTRAENYVAEATLSEKAGTLEFFGVGGHFVEFPGAEVEVRVVNGEKRYVKFKYDQYGHPILTSEGRPVIMDLQNKDLYWNWPEFMDPTWFTELKKSRDEIVQLQERQAKGDKIGKLNEKILGIVAGIKPMIQRHSASRLVPPLFLGSYQDIGPLAGNAETRMKAIPALLTHINGVIASVEKILDSDETPIRSSTGDFVKRPSETKYINHPTTVYEALQKGFRHVWPQDDGYVPAPGYRVRRRLESGGPPLLISLDARLSRGDTLILDHRISTPDQPEAETESVPEPGPPAPASAAPPVESIPAPAPTADRLQPTSSPETALQNAPMLPAIVPAPSEITARLVKDVTVQYQGRTYTLDGPPSLTDMYGSPMYRVSARPSGLSSSITLFVSDLTKLVLVSKPIGMIDSRNVQGSAAFNYEQAKANRDPIGMRKALVEQAPRDEAYLFEPIVQAIHAAMATGQVLNPDALMKMIKGDIQKSWELFRTAHFGDGTRQLLVDGTWVSFEQAVERLRDLHQFVAGFMAHRAFYAGSQATLETIRAFGIEGHSFKNAVQHAVLEAA